MNNNLKLVIDIHVLDIDLTQPKIDISQLNADKRSKRSKTTH